MLVDSAKMKKILTSCRTIAVVGLSPKVNRPSNMVARYLLDAGYTIVPVNPGQDQILKLRCYPTVRDIPYTVDIVDIFRKSDQVGSIIEDAIAKKVQAVWMQEGVVNKEAAQKATEAGIIVFMDRCIKTDHAELMGLFNKTSI